jgi:UDP-N-acetylmuramate dehydrogenase
MHYLCAVMITEYKSLKGLNSFGFEAKARYFAAPESVDGVRELLRMFAGTPVFVLGGGNNVVFAADFEGLVINPQMTGMETVDDSERYTLVKVGAGVVWDEFVRFAVENDLSGVENLSGIPGSVGASPVQNVGAYGMEAKDSIVSVDGVFTDSGAVFGMSNAECRFAYRDSIFKNGLRRKALVTHVTFRLSKVHGFKLDYGNLRDEATRCGAPDLNSVRNAVLVVRAGKLPDPKVTGNAGSFFKNPVVETEMAEELWRRYPQMPMFPAGRATKLSAAWLIETCGLKGCRSGNVGVHEKQSLVLVNCGGGTAAELLEFAHRIQATVEERFGVCLEPEVVVV